MVIIGGGWGSGRRGYGPYGRSGYRRRYGGGGSCLRDACLVESGCCLAEAIGCGPQLGLLAPVLTFRALRTGQPPGGPREGRSGQRAHALALALVHAYQDEVSPRRARPCCRYTPTCSAYALQALETHGLLRGLLLTAGRLLRCRPGSTGGHDPVPT